MRSVLLVVLAASFAPLYAETPEEEAARMQKEAEEAHEKAAQKALTDSLTDALAMMRHGSARAKEQAARSIAQLAIETTISQPFHPVTCAALFVMRLQSTLCHECSYLSMSLHSSHHGFLDLLGCAGSATLACVPGFCRSWSAFSLVPLRAPCRRSPHSRPSRPTIRTQI